MRISGELKIEISDFLSTIPNIADRDTRYALLERAPLDEELRVHISLDGLVMKFVSSLISTVSDYGKLENGQDALEAVLEAAKRFVGVDRRDVCDELIEKWRAWQKEHEKSKQQEAPGPEQERPSSQYQETRATFAPGYTYDLFINHAEADKLWVTKFTEDLEHQLTNSLGTVNCFSLWKSEHRSMTVDALNDIEQTAVLVIVLSHAYLDSRRCERERKIFLDMLKQKNSSAIGRVYVVELEKIAGYYGEFQALRGLERGRRFWECDRESGTMRTLDETEARASGDYANNRYIEQLNDLCLRLTEELRHLASPPHEEGSSSGHSLFLADTNDELYWKREELRRSLEQAGIRVFPKVNLCSEYEYVNNPRSCEEAVRQHLEQCEFFVQLLDKEAGEHIEERPAYHPFLYEQACDADTSILQWSSPELRPETVMDGEQRKLLQSESVSRMPLEEFKQKVQQSVSQSEKKSSLEGELVLIDADEIDSHLAEEIGELAKRYQVGWVFIEERENVLKELEEYIQYCDGIIVVYGKANPFWAKKQILSCNSMVYRRKKPLPVCLAVFDGPPEEKPPLKLHIPGVSMIECRDGIFKEQFELFLQNLQARERT